MKYRNKQKRQILSVPNYLGSLSAFLFLTLSGPLSAQPANSEATATPPVQTAPSPSAPTTAPLPVQAASNPSSQSALEPVTNALTRALLQRGVVSCASRVEQVSRFLDFGTKAGAYLMPPPAPADRRLFSLQIEISAGAAGNSFVDMSFAPQQANGCGATYQTVNYWPQTCETVGRQQFPNIKSSPPLQRDVALLNIGPMTKVFLMRAGNDGCISIKKEIVL